MPSTPARPAPPEPARPEDRHVVLAVDLTALGARPGGHGPHGVVVPRPFDGERLARLVHRADRGLLDLVLLGDAFLLHPGRRQVPGRLDAAVAAARVAPLGTGTALVAGVAHEHVDPAHVAGAVRGVQRAGRGPAGWLLSGPASGADEREWAARAEAAVAAVEGEWDGPGDAGALLLDPDGRFRVDHDGVRFAVRGRAAAVPVPGPAAGRPLVVVPVSGAAGAALAGRRGDVARIAVPDVAQGARLRSLVRDAAAVAGRPAGAVRVLADVDVALADDPETAAARLALARSGDGGGTAHAGARVPVLAGTGADLAALAAAWVDASAADGFVVRPSAPEVDLDALVDRVVPALQHAGLFRLRPSAALATT
ncbi:LLM class flavin-dependent oxidoreductase [Cellulomonas hominis]|uniref:LLM class flavin-dependent oxidoreductase n=1 Tax=Cellulomonas hominis TaxID=156981 RepID=UPI001B9DBDE4|nr:LLM class flavin-dependent oxidoreductase [Cellulomonas hominis]VTR77889.1 Putative monooxygenase MoxC [Cellulomonas hominis]